MRTELKNVKYDTIAEKNFFFRNGIHVAGLIVLLNLIPFFGISATFTWDGSTSTSWNTGSNWVGGTVPGTNDNAAIPGGLVNYPVITSNVTIRNISVNSSGTGGKLTINAGTVNARRVSIRTGGIMTVTNGQLNCTRFSVAGSVTMSGGTILSSGTFSISNGGVVNQSNGIIHLGNNINSTPSSDLRIDAGGTFNQSGGTIEIQDLLAGSGIFNQTGSSALFSIDADWLMGTGSTFNATAGTVQFTDDGNQSNFASGTRQFCNIVIDNNVDPGFSNSNPSTIPISGNFTNNSNSFSNTANSTFTFNGSGSQTIYSAITNTNATFGNLVINKPAGIVQLLSNIYSSSNLTLTTGTFDLDIYRCNRSSNGGTLNIGANTFLLVGGTTGGATGSNFPLGFTSVVIASTSTVHYDGANQTVALYTYGNLALSGISGAVIKTMPSTALTIAGNFSTSLGTATSVSCTALSNLTIAGSFTIGTGTTFTGGVFIHSIAGNILITGIYISTSNKIILNGLLTQNISSVSAFNKLVINKNTGMVNLNSNISLNDSIVFIKGNVRTTIFKVILNTTGKIGGASPTTGWVFGTLQLPFATGSNITKTFDVGDSLKYSPAVLNITTVTIAGGVSAKVTGTDHPLISNSTLNAIRDVNRYWTFTNNGLGFNNCKITFNWLATDIDAGSTTSLFKVARYSGVWDTTAVLLPLPTSIQATNLTFFGDFAVGERCGTTVAGTWTGALSTDWSAPENWQCGLIPNSTINVLISTGLIRYPVLSSGIGSAKNITIQTGASVTVTNATLQISGLISNSGLFNVANGTVEMNGTTAQIIPANVFSGNTISNLTTNNAAGVSLSGLLNITGILKATIGNFNTGGFVTLVSNATQSALIDGAGNGEVLGNVNMQRYLPVGFGYKYFSSPFLNATVNEFSDDLNLLSAFHPFYKYDESLNSSGWVNYSSPAGVLVPFVGYAANFGNSTAPKTVDVSGVVNNHLKTINIKNNNKPFTLGFNLVGNPYPSPIDWDAATGWTRTNVDNAVYYFDASATDQYGGSYSSYINGISSNGIAGNIIPAMQGFFVHVSNGTFPVNGSLQINNPARTTQLQPVFHRESSTDPTPLIRIETGFADFGFQNDAMVVYFDQQATVGFNKENDALKLMNTDSYIPNIYTFSSDANRLSINALPDALETIDKIPVGLKIETDGWVKFNASKIVAIPDSLNIYFVDSELRTNHDLRKTPEFRINMKKGVYETRFFLAFTENEFPFITDTDEFGIYSYGESVFIYYNLDEGMKGEMTISNLQGQLVWKTELQHTGHFDIQPHLSAGIYVANFRSGNNVFSKKIFINGK